MQDAGHDGAAAGPKNSGSLTGTAKLTSSSRYADIISKVWVTPWHCPAGIIGWAVVSSVQRQSREPAQSACLHRPSSPVQAEGLRKLRTDVPRYGRRWQRGTKQRSRPRGRGHPSRTQPTSGTLCHIHACIHAIHFGQMRSSWALQISCACSTGTGCML
jgi:hypothetical protein